MSERRLITKPVFVCQNTRREQPGHIASLLDKWRLESEIVNFESVGSHQLDPARYSAVVILGGPQSANDKNDTMHRELDFVGRVVDAGVPYLGICLGMQVLVKATGGTVVPNDVKEIGLKGKNNAYFLVTLTPAGGSSSLFRTIEQQFAVFHLHGETVRPGRDQIVLATGTDCFVQAVQVGSTAFGVQFHPELDLALFDVLRREDPDLSSLDQSILVRDYNILKLALNFHGRTIIDNFLAITARSTLIQ